MTNRILRIKQVTDYTGLSRAAVYRLMQEKEFPQSIRITKRCVGWEERQIQTWIESQIKKSIESEGATND
ncbi:MULTISPECIES: AlpA family transcriptional regulator [unclassified Oleiphilus]|uniref:helix-turn-helix transcriptional regulator n=1 Tax=unclassified Oleiphilus TaxID=2631174 RepID=UPI0007C24599|nr:MULTISPECIES: AlpA family transcriptional regulator [unclassified Oleiphilus]KZY45502.1 hypothetical protein A3732_10220 [Oleiphilus sp. HI0050]KZZ36591.1 hypothetical protein A3757_13455 [Oleiphilus sp. HI0117]KZZ53333.1 hypothetical protein A3761_17340 [Oleiphilus sp. HI0123]